jgi:hypothetical protein
MSLWNPAITGFGDAGLLNLIGWYVCYLVGELLWCL